MNNNLKRFYSVMIVVGVLFFGLSKVIAQDVYNIVGSQSIDKEGVAFRKGQNIFLKDKDMELTRKTYNMFLESYPEGMFATKAQYMIAETFYLEGMNLLKKIKKQKISENEVHNKFKQAILEYEKIMEESDDDFIVENALYRTAECYFVMGNYEKAFEICETNTFEYLLVDSLFLLGQTYLQTIDEAEFSEERWNIVEDIFQDLLAEDKIVDVMLLLGYAYFWQEDYDQAISMFKEVDKVEGKYFLGKSYEKQGKNLLAIGEYRALIREYSKSKRYVRRAYFDIAENFLSLKDYSLAIDEMRNFIKLYPKSKLKNFALYKVGHSYFLNEKYLDAIEVLKQVVATASEHIELASYAQYLIGESYYKLNDLSSAISAYNKCVELFPRTDNAKVSNYMVGWCYYQKSNFVKTEEVLKKFITKLSKDEIMFTYANYLLGNAFYLNKKYPEALKRYQVIVDQKPLEEINNFRESSFFMMNIISYKQGDYTRIATGYHYILKKLMPSSEGNDYRLRTYFMVGDACYRLKYIKEAKALFEELEEVYYRDDILYVRILNNLAWCYFEEKDYESALETRENIVEVISESTEEMPKVEARNYLELANILFNQKEYMDALENYETFAKSSPDDHENLPEVLYRLGTCYYRLEYYSQALNEWAKLLKKYPKAKIAKQVGYKLADTFYKAGKYEEGISAYRTLIELYKKGPEVEESYLRIGQSYFNAKNYVQAINSFKEFIVHYPNSIEVTSSLDAIEASIYRKSQAKGSAAVAAEFDALFIDYITKYSKEKIISDIAYRIGKNYYNEDIYDKAVERIESFFNKGYYDINNATVTSKSQYYLAESEYFLKKYEQAAKSYNRLLNNFKKFEQIPKIYFRIGSSYFKLNNYEKAIASYNKLINEYEDSEYAKMGLFNLGLAYKKADKLSEASESFMKYYETYPDEENAVGLMTEAGDIYKKQRDFNKAINVYKKLIDDGKLNQEQIIEVQYKIAQSYQKMGDKESTIPAYEALRDLEPKEDKTRLAALIKLAELYQKTKQLDLAEEIYHEVLEYTTDEQWRKAIKSRLEVIESEK